MSEKICEDGMVHTSVEDAIAHVVEQEGAFNDPMWGDKYTTNLRNIGMVIGRQQADPRISWRLDYDPVKGLHLNFEDKTVQEKRAIYHKIAAPFLKTPEELMVEYWLAWTKKNCDKIPHDLAQQFKTTFNTVVNLGGGGGDVGAGKTRMNMTKFALYGYGQIT
jgi:hypothetical protein